MTEVTKLFADQQPGPEDTAVGPSFVGVARSISQICATRILLLICVLTGSGIWVWTTFDPSRDRLFAAVAFSLVFVLPQILLYWKRG